MPSRQVNVQFEPREGIVPFFANVALVNSVSDDMIMSFGFVDPMQLANLDSDNGADQPPTIQATTVVRVVMNRNNARQFLKSLSDALERSEAADADNKDTTAK